MNNFEIHALFHKHTMDDIGVLYETEIGEPARPKFAFLIHKAIRMIAGDDGIVPCELDNVPMTDLYQIVSEQKIDLKRENGLAGLVTLEMKKKNAPFDLYAGYVSSHYRATFINRCGGIFSSPPINKGMANSLYDHKDILLSGSGFDEIVNYVEVMR